MKPTMLSSTTSNGSVATQGTQDSTTVTSSSTPPPTQVQQPQPQIQLSISEEDKNMASARVMAQPAPLVTQNLQDFSDSPSAGSPSTVSPRRVSRSRLSLDMSSVPPMSSPSPPSNTLLITRLNDPKIFQAASLATIREHLGSIAPLNSFSPLKSMARIIVSFYSEQDCIKMRQEIDGTAFTDKALAKCYFGEPTPIDPEMKFLERPDAGKLFFISPPPSPPVGWESKAEDPPNKEIYAEDLASKLSRLAGRDSLPDSPVEGSMPTFTADSLAKLKQATHGRAASISAEAASGPATPTGGRSRSSTLIYDPKAHANSPGLPAVVLDAEDELPELDSDSGRPPMAHTSRPPVELME